MDLPTCSAEQKTGEAHATVVPEERQHPEAGGTQEGQETEDAIFPEERQQPEAGGTQEGQETGEANVPEERQHPEADRTQEKRWELPTKLLVNKAVWNIQSKDDMCFFWSIRHATKLRILQEECRCGREEDLFGSGYRHASNAPHYWTPKRRSTNDTPARRPAGGTTETWQDIVPPERRHRGAIFGAQPELSEPDTDAGEFW